jgi:hypothetical protein
MSVTRIGTPRTYRLSHDGSSYSADSVNNELFELPPDEGPNPVACYLAVIWVHRSAENS